MGVANYERQLDSAFALYQSLGITAVKTGYVGDKTRAGDAHHSQLMVRHFRKVVETAAKYGITIDAHEPIKDTGERRTYPAWRRGKGRGQECCGGGGAKSAGTRGRSCSSRDCFRGRWTTPPGSS